MKPLEIIATEPPVSLKDMNISFIHKLPRKVKQSTLIAVDFVVLPICFWASFAITENAWFPEKLYSIGWAFPLVIFIAVPIFIRSGMYRAILHKADYTFFTTIFKMILISLSITIAVVELFSSVEIHWLTWLLDCVFLLALIGGFRWYAYLMLTRDQVSPTNKIPVAIYGAGSSGHQLCIVLEKNPDIYPVLFIDDLKSLHHAKIRGRCIYPPSELPYLIKQFNIQRILLSMPSVDRHKRQKIIQFLESFSIHVQDVPSMSELVSGKKSVDDIREISEEDLLRRDPVPPIPHLMRACVVGKVVMVTGAGGSIGSELCRQILKLSPLKLVLVERSEYFLFAIMEELTRLNENLGENRITIVPQLGSVRHLRRMRNIIVDHHVETVYHAAAYKHVSIVEQNPIEGIQNNVFGTYYLAQAAIAGKVKNLVLISTDKAVRPTNAMGASKRWAEMIVQACAHTQTETCFSIVRFGNVMDSSGSAMPIFRRQIRRGGPVTVTHPEVTRFFMTIPEATQLVIQSGTMAEGGDVFVLDMGDPVRIMDLVQRMIKFSGLTVRDEQNPGGDIAIEITGLKPGEKLHEELLIGNNVSQTNHPKIMRVKENCLPMDQLEMFLEQLDKASRAFDYDGIRTILAQSVENYKPSDSFGSAVR